MLSFNLISRPASTLGVVIFGVPGFFNLDSFGFAAVDALADPWISMTVEWEDVPAVAPNPVELWLTSTFDRSSVGAVVFILFSAFSDFSNWDLNEKGI